jgi:hypothetical protein
MNTIESKPFVSLTRVSGNKKTGPIPVSTTSAATCPDACPFKASVCYAEHGPVSIHWRKVTNGQLPNATWDNFLSQIKSLPNGQLWRHNQAGDLPGENDTLDIVLLAQLVNANRNKRGFTFTHKPLTTQEEREAIRNANSSGFTVNLSGNNLAHADELVDIDCGPVVTVLPESIQGNVQVFTPKGRRVVVCPATYRENVTCASCQLCARQNRLVIVGFPVHGNGKKRYSG